NATYILYRCNTTWSFSISLKSIKSRSSTSGWQCSHYQTSASVLTAHIFERKSDVSAPSTALNKNWAERCATCSISKRYTSSKRTFFSKQKSRNLDTRRRKKRTRLETKRIYWHSHENGVQP